MLCPVGVAVVVVVAATLKGDVSRSTEL
ncbi:unnamed protein product [Calypogeia fissa]